MGSSVLGKAVVGDNWSAGAECGCTVWQLEGVVCKSWWWWRGWWWRRCRLRTNNCLSPYHSGTVPADTLGAEFSNAAPNASEGKVNAVAKVVSGTGKGTVG